MNLKKLPLLSGVQLIMTILLLFLIYHLAHQAAMLTSAASAQPVTAASPVVVVDSGHGGAFYRQE